MNETMNLHNKKPILRKVQILLSSYNGEKYIEQQIKSLLDQKDVSVSILIRDDGSTDNTCLIIEQLSDSRIKLIKGENLGYKRSFLELVYLSDNEADYFAFCDQDDYWFPEKLIRAIFKCNFVNFSPVLYHSKSTYSDENLTPLNKERNFILPKDNVQALALHFAQGCTIVFNKKLRDILIEYKPKYDFAFDFWIPLVCMYIGKIISDNQSYILYRTHANNVFNTSKSSIFTEFKNSQKRWYGGDNIYSYAEELLNGFDKYLVPENREILKKILSSRNNIIKRIRISMSSSLRMSTLKGTILLKLRIIFGSN